MSHYKLIHFNARALAEPIRWIFSYANVPFEDDRINLADWPAMKNNPDFPTGQLPVLLEDGKVMTQSYSIARYLCRKFNIVSDDAFLNYRSEQVVDIVQDSRAEFIPLGLEKFVGEDDPVKVQEMTVNLVNNVFPRYFKQITELLAETEGDFIAGNQVTVGDFILANWLEVYEDSVDPKVLDNFPALKKHQQAVLNIPEVKAWVAQRPQTPV